MGISNTKLYVQYTFTTAIGYNTRGESFSVYIKTNTGRRRTKRVEIVNVWRG